jgi:hypothetical protein
LTLPAASEIKSTTTETKDLIMKVYSCHDNEIPKDVDFDSNCERIFCITERGVFSIWDFKSLDLMIQISFGLQTSAMIVFKSRLMVAVGFEKKLIVLDVANKERAVQVDSFNLEFDLVASDIKLNYEEKILAVAMAPNYETNTIIKIYSVDYESKRFVSYHVIENISSR